MFLVKRRLVFHKTTESFFSNKRKNQYDHNGTIIRKNPHAYARITGVLSFLLSQVSQFCNNILINNSL